MLYWTVLEASSEISPQRSVGEGEGKIESDMRDFVACSSFPWQVIIRSRPMA